MIESTYDPSTKIISTNYIGKIDMHEIVEYINSLSIEDDFYDDLLYFVDQTAAEFIFKPSEIKKVVHALYAKMRDIPTIRVAVLNSNPKETAFSIIAMRLLSSSNISASVFSTKEAALDWLLINRFATKQAIKQKA